MSDEEVVLHSYPRLDKPYSRAEVGERHIEVAHGRERLALDL
ncbi:MAG: hypothetical protein RLZZ387_5501 [Chloroflexota bacterium]